MRLIIFIVSLLVSFAVEAKSVDAFSPQWEYSTGNALPQAIVKDSGRPYLYVAAKSGGLLVLDISAPGKPEAAASIPVDHLSGLHAMKVTQAGDYLYLALGDFFDTTGQKAGIAIIDVRNPRVPVVVSVRVTDRKLHGAADILVSGNYAYLATMEYGISIFDVADKKDIKFVSSFVPDPDDPRKNAGGMQRPNARGLALRGDMLFVAYDAGGVRAIDVSDKTHPHEISRYINSSMVRKQQAYNNMVLSGNTMYVAVDYCGLEIVDISDIQNMKQIGWFNPWHCDALLSLWFNSNGHTNQLALDHQQPFVYLSGGDSDLLVVDVSNPAVPRLAAMYGSLKDGLGTWGMTVDGQDIYLAYIKAFMPFRGTWSGIRAIRH